jgi:hypothetical protein
MYSLNELRPIELTDLVRVGRKMDGGYVLTQRQIDKTKTLLSFGVCDDWSFEADFLQRKKGIVLYAYDYSVSAKFFLERMRNVLIKLRPRFRIAANKFLKLLLFHIFFNPKKNRFFFKKFVGVLNNEQYISVPDIFKTHLKSSPEALSVFVKMDIEDSEYRVLHAFKPYYPLINGFTVEFHSLDICSHIFNETIKELSADFYVAHVHGNNCGGYIRNSPLPMVLEITFINKKLVAATPVASTKSYPVAGLDFPCGKHCPDLPLVFP